jgi:hypothetical protein
MSGLGGKRQDMCDQRQRMCDARCAYVYAGLYLP